MARPPSTGTKSPTERAPFEGTTILAAMPLDDADGAPEWMHLLNAGVNKTVDGRGPFKVDAGAVVASSWRPGDRLAIDVNHSIDVAAPKGQPSPAVGWITELQARDTGVWGKVEWTPIGNRLVRNKSYRHQSPVIQHTQDGTVKAILRASLTNNPNLRDLTALNSTETDVSLISSVRTALSLPETADEAACLSALTTLSTNAEAVSTLAEIRTELKLGENATTEALLAAIRTNSSALKDQVTSLQVQIIDQDKQLKALNDANKRGAAERFVDDAIKAGRVGVKPLRDHYVSRHMADAAAVEKEITAMPTVAGRLLDDKGTPTSRLAAEASADEIAAAADKHIKEQAEKGISLNFAQAVRAVSPA